MKLTLNLPADISIALRRFMAEHGLTTPKEAMSVIATDWLTTMGHMEPEHELNEYTETAGEA